MIRRATFLIAILGVMLAIAWLNPPRTPEPAENPRYVKLDRNGQRLGAWEGPWACVHDTLTGLTWEVKSYAEDLHDQQCSFTWFDGRIGVANGGSCFHKGSGSDTKDLINHANEETLCGLKGWRLPAERELRTLLIDTPLPGDVLIARDYFPYAQRGSFWTADAEVRLTDHYAHLGKGAISIDFGSGRSRSLPYRDAAFVRLVAESGS